jgi:two-component system, NtrC family, sensor kinase
MSNNMRQSEIRYRRLFEAAQDGILILDTTSRKITDSNPFMSKLLGYSREELLGKELWQIGLLEDELASQVAFRELQENGFIRYEDLPLQSNTGELREVEFVSNLYDEDGTSVIQCNIRDITERRRAQVLLKVKEEQQAQLIQSAKMTSLERLVAGIAHEINNPLMFVMTNLSSSDSTLENITPEIEPSLTDKSLSRFRKVRVRLTEMKEGLDRVKQLVLSLRTFSRLDEAGMKVVDVAQSIQSVLLLLNYTMKGRIAVQTLLDPECLLYCSGAKLNQLLMSLITNAVEAIAGTGTITISGHSIGHTFVISVRDTGKGIPAAIMEHIFDPFFTTKNIGDGGGLGLALAYGIAHEHLGTIEVQSKEGIGSEFIVKIPLDLESRLGPLQMVG